VSMACRLGGKVSYLAFLKQTPFLALLGLRALLVVAPLDGIAHRRHIGRVLGFVFWGYLVRRCDRRKLSLQLWKFWQETYR
jgi:hypothetical protein